MNDLYELKQNLAMVGAQLQKVAEDITKKAANPSVDIEEINELEKTKANLQKRYDLIKEEHDRQEAEARKKFQNENKVAAARDEKERIIAAKAAFYRAAILKREIPDDVRAVLKAIPAGGSNTTGGENLLPTTLSNELVHEPFVTNPLREIIRVSNITGLEVPKIAFSLDNDDDGFINDDAVAKEISATGDKVQFGRFKFKVKVKISDTVIHGSDLDLVTYVENALRSGLAAKEKKVSFAAADDQVTGEQHMSFYQESSDDVYVIDTVEGGDYYEAITNAIADLHEDFRENAKVVMRYADYVTMLKELSNGSMDLYRVQPEQIIGKPVIFCDSATVPIVGDFGYCRLNYDGDLVYDADKDVDKGNYIWVLTGWFDQHRLLNSAFRLAVLEEND